MNRLILIGNGFDLAHGLKTSYKDFIIWYLVKCFGNVGYSPRIYQDKLLQIRFSNFNSFTSIINAHKQDWSKVRLTEEDLIYFISNHFEQRTIKELLNINENNTSDLTLVNDNESYSPHYHKEAFCVHVSSDFLRNLIINCQDCNWVDIEDEYFAQLKKYKNKDGVFDRDKIKQLNEEFKYLKEKLEDYLSLQQENAIIEVIPELLDVIKLDFVLGDFDTTMSKKEFNENFMSYPDKGIYKFNRLYFLNFNYTNTLASYIAELEKGQSVFKQFDINHIHGELSSQLNPIIFGFGDEHDKQYLEFEEYKNNDLFTHIKSYQYFKTPNYRNLIRFLNDGDYQVFIIGHSCGLSDRTMFKEIFDRENCKSVRVFHYQKPDGTNDFWEKTVNLGRHFSAKGRMRKLIVEFNEANTFPQCN